MLDVGVGGNAGAAGAGEGGTGGSSFNSDCRMKIDGIAVPAPTSKTDLPRRDRGL